MVRATEGPFGEAFFSCGGIPPDVGVEDGARNIVRNALGVRHEEQVLVLVDAPNAALGESLLNAAEEAEAESLLLRIPSLAKAGQEPPAPAAAAMMECDAAILVTRQSLTHTHARRAATKAGARVVSMPGANVGMFAEGALLADHEEIARTMRRFARRLHNVRRVSLTDEGGTELSFSVRGREWITEDTGLCRHAGQCVNLPAGEVFVAALEGTAEGHLVVDGSFAGPLRDPAKVTVKEGYATRIVGAPPAIHEMNKGGRDGRTFARFGVGLNPKARVVGDPLEDAKVIGAAHVVFGDNFALGGRTQSGVTVHAVLRKPTLRLDDRVVVEAGTLRV